tara:strand:+ start:273 stop:521 length:249 start_codon:yes stop_codon:yes gene_type:complete
MKTKIKNELTHYYKKSTVKSLHLVEQELMRDELWDYMLFHEIATEDELMLVTNINGFRLDVLESILYARTGFHDLKQYKECN